MNQDELIKMLRETLEAAREEIVSRADKDEMADDWSIVVKIDSTLSASAEPVKGEPVAYRYRHSAQENWHYGESPQNWWECQPLYAPPAAMEAADGREAAQETMKTCINECWKVPGVCTSERKCDAKAALASSPSAAPAGKVPTCDTCGGKGGWWSSAMADSPSTWATCPACTAAPSQPQEPEAGEREESK